MRDLLIQIRRVIRALWNLGEDWGGRTIDWIEPRAERAIRRAQKVIRAAICILIGWPFLMVAAALVSPETARILVPVVALLPLVVVVILLLTTLNPVVIGAVTGAMATISLGRKALRLIAAFIGFELLTGLYLAVVPVSSNRGLIPILALALVTLGFMRLGGIKGKWVRVPAAVVLVLTYLFFSSFFKEKEREEAKQRPVAAARVVPGSIVIDLNCGTRPYVLPDGIVLKRTVLHVPQCPNVGPAQPIQILNPDRYFQARAYDSRGPRYNNYVEEIYYDEDRAGIEHLPPNTWIPFAGGKFERMTDTHTVNVADRLRFTNTELDEEKKTITIVVDFS